MSLCSCFQWLYVNHRELPSLRKWVGILLLHTSFVSALSQTTRERNDTINVPVQPAQITGELILRDAFPGVYLNKPVAIRAAPGEDHRLFVAERGGRILVLNNLSSPSLEVFLDIRSRVVASSWEGSDSGSRRAEGLTSFALHPNFRENGRFFVSYCTFTGTSQGRGHHNRLSEFQASADRRTADAASEIPYITQFDEGDGHNINDLHFGADSYLYVAIGDEGDGGRGDDYNNAQKIDKDFFSGVLRIDVDKREGNYPRNPHPAASDSYFIPRDNPFVDLSSWQGRTLDKSKIRDEFWAVGLRNPWRISFDPQTGALYCGDVGQHGRDEINRIVKGGNYGWSYREGDLAGPAGNSATAVDLIPPLVQYEPGMGPNQGYSVTGGVVYRGSRLPGLFGRLIYADFVSGNIWTLNVDQNPAPAPIRILAEAGIAGFGYDPRNGDVLAVNHDRGVIKRLDVSGGGGLNIPVKLSEAGIFADINTLAPHRGIYPYDVNQPFWSDGASKRRWFSIPDPAKKIVFNSASNWLFPSGSYWIKHFELETVVGDANSRKRVETRVLVKTQTSAYGITYKWNDAGTDAELVGESGDMKQYAVRTGSGTREQTWRFPSRQECMNCHTVSAGLVLGFNAHQLHRNDGFGGENQNQITALASAGYFESTPAELRGVRALASVADETVSRAYRVKSYLAANCAQCHQPQGSARGTWDARITTPLSQANIINGMLYNAAPESNDRVVVPGDPGRSALLKRIQLLGKDRMPPIGSHVLDENGINLLSSWISEDLRGYESYEQWSNRTFAGTSADETIFADADGDGSANFAEYLLGSNPIARDGKLQLGFDLEQGAVVISFVQPANVGLLIDGAAALNPNPWALMPIAEKMLSFPKEPLLHRLRVPLDTSHKFLHFKVVEP